MAKFVLFVMIPMLGYAIGLVCGIVIGSRL